MTKPSDLTPDLLRQMTVDKWLDQFSYSFEDSTWPIHDRIMGIQSMVLTRLLNPGTLRMSMTTNSSRPPKRT